MSVRLGSLDGVTRATVDGRGRLQLDGARWSLGWAVRGGDGWHRPDSARPASVTQRRLDGTPVVETSLRVPGGQAVHRAYVARAVDGTDAALVEIENRSTTPIGVALVVGGAARVGLADRTVTVDREVGLFLPRCPSRVATSLEEVLDDGGSGVWPGEVRSRRRRGEAVFVLPLAHTARLRVVVGARVGAGELPDPERVAAGWMSHLAAGMRVELADATRLAAVRADLADLLLAEDLDPDAMIALDRFGHHTAAGRDLWRAVDDQRLHLDGGATVVALAEHWRLTGDGALLDAAVGAVAAAAHRLRRGAPSVQLAAAELLDSAGQPEAAQLCRGRVPAVGDASPPAATTRARHGALPSARLLDLRDQLVAESAVGPVMAPAWPQEWLGQPLEVHDAPTRWGHLSYAVRWHGSRPALLWEREGSGAVVLTTGLDRAWASTDARGEALLAPVEPAGGLPKVVAPLAGPGTPVDEVDTEGPGFT